MAKTASISAATVSKMLRKNGITGRRGPKDNRAPGQRRQLELLAAEVAELDGPILRELRVLGRPPLSAAGDAARLRRDELLVELRDSDPEFWSWPRLAAAAVGMTPEGVRSAVRQQRRSGDVRRVRLVVVGREAEAARSRRAAAKRFERLAGEVAAHADDPRVKRLQYLTRTIGRGRGADRAVRAERLGIVAALWTDDPRFWTGERLSLAMGLEPASGSTVGQMLREVRQSVAARSVRGQLYG